MRFKFGSAALLLLAASVTNLPAALADWPQWRGADRTGALTGGPALVSTWSTDGPPKLWESQPIPSDDDGGHGSVVIAGGRVYLSVVWHREQLSETRTLTELILRTQLGHQNPASLGKELVAKIEAARESLPPTLRGAKLEEFTQKFIEENLDKKQRQLFSGFVSGRFKKGKLAIPLGDYEKLQTRVDKPFPSQAEFEKWVNEQGFVDHVKTAVLAAVPPSRRVAEDTVVCLDAKSGQTLWMTKTPGEPKGRNCSSTPCVAGGRVYAMGSTHLNAVDATSGKLLWSQPLPAKAPGSSPLALEGAVVILAGKLAAYEAETGKQLWEQPKVGGNNASPSAWQKDGKTILVCNSRNEFVGVDLKTGTVLWTTPGGGDSTPAIVGDRAVVLSKDGKVGFAGYRLSTTGAEKLWNHPTDALRAQSSPAIHENHAYLFEDGEHRCVNLESGKIAWAQKVASTITSPIVADGKIYVLMNNGNNLLMLKATPQDRVELEKANVRALWIPTPAIADGKVFLRHRDRVCCYNLARAID